MLLMRTISVVLLLVSLAQSATAQTAPLQIEQQAPLPVVSKESGGKSEPLSFTLEVAALCPDSDAASHVMLGLADATQVITPDGAAPLRVALDIDFQQLAGLQVATLCERTDETLQDGTPWVLPGAFTVQATLICTSLNSERHYPAATPVDIAIDCSTQRDDTTALEDVPPEN